jgi:hypothetical protein
MHAAVRPYVATGVALLAASVIAVSPVAPPPPREIDVAYPAVRLVADASVVNIPINLIQDIINIPYNEVQAINDLGRNLLFSGTWVALPTSTNVWGTDPGDLGHWYGLANLIPFPTFSNALGAQLVGLAEVLLPINSTCNDVECPSDAELRASWWQPARIEELLTTGQYTFDDTPVTYPDGTIHPPEGLWSFGGPITWGAQYGHPEWNTRTDPATGDPVVPWAGTTFTLDPLSPLTNYFTHLMSDPTSPDNTIKVPTPEQISTAFTNLGDGLFVAFSPFFPGSPWCLGLCGPPSDMKPPFFWDTLPPWLETTVNTTASLDQNSASVGANAVSIPQDSGVQQSGGVAQGEAPQSGAGEQNGGVQQNDATQNGFVNLSTAKSVEEPPALQKVPETAAPQTEQGSHVAVTANGTSNQSRTTSTNPPDDAKKRTVTDDVSKFGPRQVSGNGAPRGGLAGAPNATLDRSGSSRSAKPSKAANDGSTSAQQVDGGGTK